MSAKQIPPFKIQALGEIAIRCADLAPMMAFYEDLLGLERMTGDHRTGIVFYKIGAGFGGHTTVLALFAADAPQRAVHPVGKDVVAGAGSSLHHLALTVSFADQARALAWYDEIAQPYRIENFGWIGWRGVFTTDPEGNTVELVAYDESLKDPA
ncbi:MAG: VOC family protein [Pseudomonadota bacterium]